MSFNIGSLGDLLLGQSRAIALNSMRKKVLIDKARRVQRNRVNIQIVCSILMYRSKNNLIDFANKTRENEQLV